MIDRTVENIGGSSGLLAVQVALELKCTRIILCGVPMDERPHFFNYEPWKDYKVYRKAWKLNYTKLAPYVRSMSGWTRAYFGHPRDSEENNGT